MKTTIAPIKLLKGSHADTGTTGQGCFMNVIAYLNGESHITDNSPCVCTTVRRLALKLNDLGTDEQRQRLMPFVLRAMGSKTEDPTVIAARTTRLHQYGVECKDAIDKQPSIFCANAYVSASANVSANAYDYADAYAFAYAHAYACAHAYATAAGPTVYATKLKSELFDAGLRFLDDVLPLLDTPTGEVMARAARLCELAEQP